jgi:hypothetical protein
MRGLPKQMTAALSRENIPVTEIAQQFSARRQLPEVLTTYFHL